MEFTPDIDLDSISYVQIKKIPKMKGFSYFLVLRIMLWVLKRTLYEMVLLITYPIQMLKLMDKKIFTI